MKITIQMVDALFDVGPSVPGEAPYAITICLKCTAEFSCYLCPQVGIFFLGAGASVIHGLHTLMEVRVLGGEMWSYAGPCFCVWSMCVRLHVIQAALL